MKNYTRKSLKTSSGITLIALVITIIVLLILAGISISMLSGDNSILQKATDAKTQTGIGQEKETIALAYNSALAKKVSNGNSSTVNDSELNDELDSSEATASGNPIIVTFTKSGNSYKIDSNGIIKESTPAASTDQSEKIYNALKDKTPQEIIPGVDIDGITTKFLGLADMDDAIVLEYNNQVYIVSLNSSDGTVSTVAHEAPKTFTGLYYYDESTGELDTTRPFTNGYVAHDFARDYIYYDTSRTRVHVGRKSEIN